MSAVCKRDRERESVYALALNEQKTESESFVRRSRIENVNYQQNRDQIVELRIEQQQQLPLSKIKTNSSKTNKTIYKVLVNGTS